jgi:hypothetical protein
MGEAYSFRSFAENVEKFEQGRGHEMGNRKVHKDKSNMST